jgi:hemerythrin
MYYNFLSWKEEYAVGIEEIDNQHKALLEFINEALHKCTGDRKAQKAYFETLVLEVVKSLEEHFLTEEKWMQLKNYNNYAEHKEKHDSMFNELKQTIGDMQSGSRKLDLITIVIYIREWFLNHIDEMDLPMAEHIK